MKNYFQRLGIRMKDKIKFKITRAYQNVICHFGHHSEYFNMYFEVRI